MEDEDVQKMMAISVLSASSWNLSDLIDIYAEFIPELQENLKIIEKEIMSSVATMRDLSTKIWSQNKNGN